MALDFQSATMVDINGDALSQAPGSAEPAHALQVGGSDGTNLQSLLTDTSGRQQVVGAAAHGATVTGSPVLVGGSDGTDAFRLLTDSTGAQVAVGAGAAGAAIVGNAVRIGASDGTNTRDILSDVGGRLVMVGAAADGATAVGSPVQVGGVDGGGNAQALLTDTSGRLQVSATALMSATSTLSNVAASATSVTVLAANASRNGAIIVNDGTAKLYLKFGATASTSSYTALVPARGYYEVPFGYTGIIDGIWSAANGNARVTELEA